MLNYAVDPDVLRGRVPTGTLLDSWRDTSRRRWRERLFFLHTSQQRLPR